MNWENRMWDVILDTLLDTVKLIPFLYITYLLMEYLEHHAGEKTTKLVEGAGHFGPVIGAGLGVLPQCGFSAAASGLYAGRIITLGTLIAIYLSTSDEMLPILISERVEIGTVVGILACKAVIGAVAGFMIDLLWRRGRISGAHSELGKHEISRMSASEREDVVCEDACRNPSAFDGAGKNQCDCNTEDAHATRDAHGHCGEGHTHGSHNHCGESLFVAALHHTLEVTLFILIISFVLNTLLYLVGEESLQSLLQSGPILGPVIAGLVGLIPNCAASVTITQLFLKDVIDFGTMMAGLLVGAGTGVLVLFRENPNKRENLQIVTLLYLVGVGVGCLLQSVL